MKTRFVALSLVLVLPPAWAQDAAPPLPAPAPAEQAAAAASAEPKRRQGADMRHCLELKDNAAIIRCAEPGRKP